MNLEQRKQRIQGSKELNGDLGRVTGSGEEILKKRPNF